MPSEAPDPYQISFDDPTYEGGLSPKLPVPQMSVELNTPIVEIASRLRR